MKTTARTTCSVLFFQLLLGFSLPQADAQEDFNAYLKQQQQGVQKLNVEFQEYKDKQDREFADFLKGRWSEFKTLHGKVRIKEPEPEQAPVYRPAVPAKPTVAPVNPVATPVPAVPVKPAVTPIVAIPVKPAVPPTVEVPVKPIVPPVAEVPVKPSPVPIAETPVAQPVLPPPAPPQPKPLPVAANTLKIMFYGNAVNFPFDPQWKKYSVSSGDKPAAMSAFWTMMSGSKYEPTLQAMNQARQELKLDDWGWVTLWRSVAQALEPERNNEQNLLLWYFLVKSGYDVRLGYSGEDIYLFVAIKQQVYSTKFIKVSDKTYYAALAGDHGDSIHSFYTYEASYPGVLKQLDIQSASTGFTKTVPAQRTLAFNYKGKPIKFDVSYDRRLIEYLDSFPQTEFELYFDTDSSSLLRQGLLPQLKKYTSAMNEEEAVDFLLTFVQYAFAYKTDIEQFGHEKCFFVEESVFFPFNDCKDRSVIFAWLVQELLGIKVVGLLYPGHMSTGVALKQVKAEFSTVEYKGKQFVIADPTYIGASVGMAMPSYEHLKPSSVVEIQ
jgi:hypothetical protein